MSKKPKRVFANRVTIKSLQEQLKTVRESREGDRNNARTQYEELTRLRAAIDGAQAEVERLRKDLQWHKQIIQDFSAAFATHMRNR